MLIAAMVLGLIGGVTYFVGGCVGVIDWGEGTAPWWMISLIVIGAVGAMGGPIARTKPSIAGAIMLIAAAAALCVGIASWGAYDEYVADSVLSRDIVLPMHPLMGSIIYAPVPLLTLIIGGVLALSSGKKSGAED
jgi:hypothetical protein